MDKIPVMSKKLCTKNLRKTALKGDKLFVHPLPPMANHYKSLVQNKTLLSGKTRDLQ
jgi:hypothetical protein